VTAQGDVKAAGPGLGIALEARRLAKRYGPVEALRSVDLALMPGRIVALLGDNGAGKSTLLKSLCGAVTPDSGEILIDGVPVAIESMAMAHQLGIGVVFQDLSLAPDLRVYENLFLGHEVIRKDAIGRLFGLTDRETMRRACFDALAELNINLPTVETEVRRLSGGQQQAVAVARAALWAKSIVLLDEPTAALGAKQSEEVGKLIKRLASRNLAILIVSHDLPRMLELADELVVMRHGKIVWRTSAGDATVNQIVERMLTGE